MAKQVVYKLLGNTPKAYKSTKETCVVLNKHARASKIKDLTGQKI